MNGNCNCGKDATTRCDKCDKGVCRNCATVVPVPPSVDISLIRILHIKCAPPSHTSKLEHIIVNRRE